MPPGSRRAASRTARARRPYVVTSISTCSSSSPELRTASVTSSIARTSRAPASSSSPSSAIRAVSEGAPRPRSRAIFAPTCSARLRKHVSFVPVMERKRPPGPSATTRCWRETAEARVPEAPSKVRGRTPAYA